MPFAASSCENSLHVGLRRSADRADDIGKIPDRWVHYRPMSQRLKGNTKGLAPSELRMAERLFHRKLDAEELVSLEFAREIAHVAETLRRRVGVLVSREGRIEEVFLGTREILYLPDLGRYRLGRGRLRRLRLLFSDLSSHEGPFIPQDIYTDLEKLRLDVVVSIKQSGSLTSIAFAHLLPTRTLSDASTRTEVQRDLGRLQLDFTAFMRALEDELVGQFGQESEQVGPRAVLVGVYEKGDRDADYSMAELRELSRSAGLDVVETIVQRRQPDPRTLLGKGKLEELILQCLRLGADLVVFDTELRPSQWRAITNSTELKVIDRSMLILDIFAQRARSSDGRLQVELAQLKYNLPRLVEKDAGLSRLTGGIGGRGPGETKLEIGRRRARDRIAELEKRIDRLGAQRSLRRRRRKEVGLPVVAILGYTNVGKSTLFNELTKSTVTAENKLFATLDPAQRRITLPVHYGEGMVAHRTFVLSDTVGFIRNLPEELRNAFRATLEEIGEADLLLHVVDASDPRVEERRRAVDGVLRELDLFDIPQVLVLNKIDRVPADDVALLARELDAIPIAAVQRKGFDQLLAELSQRLFPVQKEELPVGGPAL